MSVIPFSPLIGETYTKLSMLIDGEWLPYFYDCTAAWIRGNRVYKDKVYGLVKPVDGVEVLVEKDNKLPEDVAKNYLQALKEWGFGDFSLNQPWTVKKEECNILKWFIQFCAIRYLWERPGALITWHEWSITEPTFDRWLLFVLTHLTGFWGNHKFISGSTCNRVDPTTIMSSLTEITGFDWSKKKHTTECLFNGGDPPQFKWNTYDWSLVTPKNWKDQYEWLASQPLK